MALRLRPVCSLVVTCLRVRGTAASPSAATCTARMPFCTTSHKSKPDHFPSTDSGDLIPNQPGPAIYRHRERSHLEQNAEFTKLIPDQPPFALLLMGTNGHDKAYFMSLFKPLKITDFEFIDYSLAHVFFDNREDLMEALKLSGHADIHHFSLVPSKYLQPTNDLSKDPAQTEFRACVSNLPKGYGEKEVQKLFKDLKVTGCLVIKDKGGQLLAFLTFPSEENLLKALSRSGQKQVQGVLLRPAYRGK